MDPDPLTLALELTQRSPAEREARYVQLRVSTAVRAEVEALLLADAGMGDTLAGRRSATRELLTRQKDLTSTDSRAPRTSTENPPLGAIGRYEIVRLLGRGGNGDVYLAHDPALDRGVAVKLIRGDFDDTAAHTRLMLEARAAGRLRHPNIVTIFDVGEHEGSPYIAMEHVPGETLRSVIRRQAELSLPRRLELIEGACAGLAHAHRAGVVHLDVKPDNLMLDDSGIVKVLDFGIARVVRSETLVTNHNVGTLRYMSPEQVSGAPLDRRSDVFSLGASCFELVAYAPAYAGSTHEMITRIADGPVPRLLDLVPEVDPRLDAIVSRAMALDPLARFDDLDELRLELARLRLDMDPEVGVHLRSRIAHSEGGRASSSVRSRPAAPRRRPGLIAALGVASLAATLVIGFGAFWATRQRPASTPAAANAPAANVPPAATGLPVAQPAPPSTPDASNGVNEVWQRLALGDKAGVLRILRPGTTNGAAPDAQLQYAVVDAVRTSVRRARDAASATSASLSSEAYRLAEERLARATRLQADKQPLDALTALWQAADYYARVTAPSEPPPIQAASGAGVSASTPGSTPTTGPGSVSSNVSSNVASNGATPGPPPGNSSRTAAGPPPVAVDSPVAPATPPVAETTRAAPPANAAPAARSDSRSATAATVPSETEAVVAALRRYQEAYKALDVSGVLQVFPALAPNQVEQLRRTFAEMTAYEIEARQTHVEVGSDVATVRAVVARRMVPRVGRPLANEVETEFRLRRDGRGWLITDVRAVPGP